MFFSDVELSALYSNRTEQRSQLFRTDQFGSIRMLEMKNSLPSTLHKQTHLVHGRQTDISYKQKFLFFRLNLENPPGSLLVWKRVCARERDVLPVWNVGCTG